MEVIRRVSPEQSLWRSETKTKHHHPKTLILKFISFIFAFAKQILAEVKAVPVMNFGCGVAFTKTLLSEIKVGLFTTLSRFFQCKVQVERILSRSAGLPQKGSCSIVIFLNYPENGVKYWV